MLSEQQKTNVMLQLCKRHVNGPNGCMNWTGPKTKGGYGIIRVGRRVIGPHRVAAYLWKGLKLSSDMKACHKCDNPSCINPDHLFVGTHADNIKDARIKGKFNNKDGERNPHCKLTTLQVAEIRSAYANGEFQYQIAKRYGVTQANISYIVIGETRRKG